MNKSYFIFPVYLALCLYINAQTITDIDGNVYNTVTIGTQVWMKENLKTTKFNDFSPIQNVSDSMVWPTLTSSACCDFENNPNNSSTYGKLYNWYAVNDPKNICPTGWHIPSDSEWSVLTNYLGGDSVAGAKLKETGNIHWLYQNTGATNSSNFTALPSGDRHYIGAFATLGYYAFWWSSTAYDVANAWKRNANYDNSSVGHSSAKKTYGFSVRCIRNLQSNNIKAISQPKLSNFIMHLDLINGKAIILFSGANNSKIDIFNCIGKKMIQTWLINGRNEIDISILPKGIYICDISNSPKHILQKVILK
jgi:uncharacterized protein (TIGR02145 family)